MLFRIFICCVAIPLLCSTVPAYAEHGPVTAAIAGEFPQVVILEWILLGYKVHFSAAVLSKNFAITSKFLSPIVDSTTTAYSGDLVNFSSARQHKVKEIIPVNELFTVVKLCPSLSPGYAAVSLAEGDNFDYQTNTTGKMVYFDSASKALKYRTASVLTDAECALNNHQDGGIQVAVPYSPPVMTCTKFDPSSDSCGHMSDIFLDTFPIVKNRPILLIGAKTAAVLLDYKCRRDDMGSLRMKSVIVYNKLKYMRAEIMNITSAVDFP